MGSTIWSPLCGGLLSGKYNKGELLEGTRSTSGFVPPSDKFKIYLANDSKEKTMKMLNGLEDIAKELNCS